MYFPTKYLRPYPKITPKPHLGGPINAKPIIQIALRKSHVNGATEGETLQLYRCIFYFFLLPLVVNKDVHVHRQVLRVCQNFSAMGRPGGAGPLNVNLGPP